MKTEKFEKLLAALDAMEYLETGRPGFDLQRHQRLRNRLVKYQRRHNLYTRLSLWSVIGASVLYLVLWLIQVVRLP